MDDERPTAGELLIQWRDATRAAELAERLAEIASQAAHEADRSSLESDQIARMAEKAADAAERAARSARKAARRAGDEVLVAARASDARSRSRCRNPAAERVAGHRQRLPR